MQYIRHIRGLTPISVASFVSLGIMDGSMPYNAIDTYSNVNTVVSNPMLSSYLKQSDNSIFPNLQLKQYFNELVSNWENNTACLSSIQQIINDHNFKKIVELKSLAVPLILIEIQKKPSMLVWALNMIYGTKISNDPQLTITGACRLWVKSMQ